MIQDIKPSVTRGEEHQNTDGKIKVTSEKSPWLCMPYKPRQHIRVDGRRFSVGRSLFRALCSLRSEDQALLLWVDAVCINQIDKREKALQVPLMRHIYQDAEEVLIWLDIDKHEKISPAATKSLMSSLSGTSPWIYMESET